MVRKKVVINFKTKPLVIETNPLLTSVISKKNLERLRKKSFIERNTIIQEALSKVEKQRRK